MRRVIFRIATACAGVAVLAGTALAQEPGADLAFTIERSDSLDLLGAARSDQASFERFRRNRLPATWGGGSTRCDERVGRFCLNHTRGGADWIAPPEDEDVVAARSNLIDGLGQIAALMSGDGWIAGQHVRYLVEARRLDEALVTARQCRAEPWWCAALTGFVHHYAARPTAADSAFARALEAMEAEERERWSDLSLILDEESVRTYRRLRGEDRTSFEDRFWRLADPLLTQPGNELRAEHLARNVWDEMQRRAQSVDGFSWGYDVREILIRYGWPTGWEQTRQFGMTTGPLPLISHYSSAPHYLLPPPDALLDESATGGVWESEGPRARTGYNVPIEDSIARWFSPLSHQVAIFTRGDSSFVVAAYSLPEDSVPADAVVNAGLALLPTVDATLEPQVVLSGSAGRTGATMLATPSRSTLLSIEVVVPSERRLARARYGVDLAPVPPGMLALSDLLLLRGEAALPDSLHQAVDAALGSTRMRSGEQIGIYWEVYGVDPAATPQISLSLRLLAARTGWLRRLGEMTGLLREVAPIRLRWEEGISSGPYLPRSVSIQIPEVSPGDYAIELTVEAPGREALSVRRGIEIVD